MRKFLLVITLIISTNSSFSQTVVLAKKTNKGIYVAADSRLTRLTKNKKTGNLDYEKDSICKILTSGKVNFAFAGLSIDSAISIAKGLSYSGKPLLEIAEQFSQIFGRYLVGKINLEMHNNPDLVKATIDMQETALSDVFVFGEDNDSLRLYAIRFLFVDGINYKFKVNYEIEPMDQIGVGKIDPIIDTVETKNIWKRGIVPTMISLIDICIAKDSVHVGYPINIVYYDKKKGIKWIQKKQLCN